MNPHSVNLNMNECKWNIVGKCIYLNCTSAVKDCKPVTVEDGVTEYSSPNIALGTFTFSLIVVHFSKNDEITIRIYLKDKNNFESSHCMPFVHNIYLVTEKGKIKKFEGQIPYNNSLLVIKNLKNIPGFGGRLNQTTVIYNMVIDFSKFDINNIQSDNVINYSEHFYFCKDNEVKLSTFHQKSRVKVLNATASWVVPTKKFNNFFLESQIFNTSINNNFNWQVVIKNILHLVMEPIILYQFKIKFTDYQNVMKKFFWKIFLVNTDDEPLHESVYSSVDEITLSEDFSRRTKEILGQNNNHFIFKFHVVVCVDEDCKYFEQQFTSTPTSIKNLAAGGNHDNEMLEEELQNVAEFLESKKLSDIQLEIGDKTINAHKAILASKSSTFMFLFSDNSNLHKLVISDFSFDVIDVMVKFIYTGKLPKHIHNMSVELLAATHKYNVKRLKRISEQIISGNINIENVVTILVASRMYHADQLEHQAMTYILSNFEKLQRVHFQELIKDADSGLLVDIMAKVSNIFLLLKSNN